MEIKQLKHLVALAEEGSFTGAARREHIVQSGLSTSIRSLEKSLGAELYVRGSRPIRLTTAGEALRASAERVLRETELGRQRVREVVGLAGGSLQLGMTQVNALEGTCPFMKWLSDFSAQHPALEVSVTQLAGKAAMKLVAEGRLDCAIVTNPEAHDDVVQTVLLEEDLVLVQSTMVGDPLPARLRLSELGNRRFVDAAAGHETRDELDELFSDCGLERRVACEARELTIVVELAAAGMGVALVPRSSAADTRLRVTEIDDLPVRYRLALIHQRHSAASPAARAFADYVASRPA